MSPSNKPLVFISYRRADNPDSVKLIVERLAEKLPQWEVFYDHLSIAPGDPFPELLRQKVFYRVPTGFFKFPPTL
jgi:hypothetical protein